MTDRDAGYREGIEAAAKVAENMVGDDGVRGSKVRNATAETIAFNIRALPLPSTPDDAEVGAVEPCCPFCGRDPFHRVDNGVGMEAVAVTCCELGDQFYRGLRPEPETVTMEWDEFVEIGQRLAGISPSPASDGAIREAFIAGATAVHNEWLAATERDEGPPRGDPDFSEAASDYAALSAHAGDAAKESGGGAESSRTVCPLTDPAKYTGGTDASRLQASAGVAPGPPDTHAETISNQENFK